MIPAHLFDSALRGFLEPIVPFLDDETVTEIMVNGPSHIFIERKGQISKTEAAFASSDKLLSALRVVAQYVGRPLDELHPVLEARLPDGSRVQALLPPVSPDGPSVAIRRFSKEKLTLGRLLELGALTLDAAETLRVLIECKQNIVVAGGTGSGKTSMLNALSALVPVGERIVVIEDARELQLQRDHVVQLEARPPDERGKGAVTIRDLFKATLRMRPDRIVLGEIRGGEALDLGAHCVAGRTPFRPELDQHEAGTVEQRTGIVAGDLLDFGERGTVVVHQSKIRSGRGRPARSSAVSAPRGWTPMCSSM